MSKEQEQDIKKQIADALDSDLYDEKNWCMCEEKTEWKHHRDGIDGLVGKHCYTCKTCDKLTQIG